MSSDQNQMRLLRSRAREILEARIWLKSAGGDVATLEHKSTLRYAAAVSACWAEIAFGDAAVLSGGVLGIAAGILLFGHAQRGLGNLFHDYAHGGFANQGQNDLFASLVIGPAILSDLELYRADHTHHHTFLGDKDLDPDFIHNPSELTRGWRFAYFKNIFDLKKWTSSFLGAVSQPSAVPMIIVWWTIFLAIQAAFFGALASGTFLVVWLLARATVFYGVTTFREMADHVGMTPGGLIAFSRNSPTHGLLRWLIHPFDNGIHIAHHLFPRIPYYHILKVNQLLMAWPAYREAEHCTSYFRHETESVIQSLSRRSGN